jgi:hypothetical protein
MAGIAHDMSRYERQLEIDKARRRIEVNVRDYWTAHGKEPRGRGTWAFCTVHPDREDYLDHVIWISGTFAAARREAVKTARDLNVGILYVCA